MRSATNGRCRWRISFLRRQFLQDDNLPFGNVLSAKTLSTALATIEGGWIDRIYTPVVTLTFGNRLKNRAPPNQKTEVAIRTKILKAFVTLDMPLSLWI